MSKGIKIGCFSVIGIFILFIIIGIVSFYSYNKTEVKNEEINAEVNVKEEKDEFSATEQTTESEPDDVSEELTEEESTINTDVFAYATKTEVTDAIDINDHVTVFVYMSEELTPGLASQHVLNQTYDFIQQEDVKDAKTISINVKQGDTKIFQFTVDTTKFKTDDEIPMSDLVLEASEVEFMTDEVKEFGEIMEMW